MGEFQDAVSVLIEAFARGLAAMKRKKEQYPRDATHKDVEKHLSKSLRKSRTDVKYAYRRDLNRFGPGFAVGDAEARSSLSAILFRLNAGFVSVIERFTRGKSTNTDYTALMNLSNASRLETLSTFEHLAKRLSQSSLALVPPSSYSEKRTRSGHKRKAKKPSSANTLKPGRSNNAPSLSISSTGWVRPKPNRKSSSGSKSSGSSTPKCSSAKYHSPTRSPRATKIVSPSQQRSSLPRPKVDNRKSIVSFASDSTKLGEIPEYKWRTPPIYDDGNVNFPVQTYYPLEPYQEPEKQRSRFMRLFRR